MDAQGRGKSLRAISGQSACETRASTLLFPPAALPNSPNGFSPYSPSVKVQWISSLRAPKRAEAHGLAPIAESKSRAVGSNKADVD